MERSGCFVAIVFTCFLAQSLLKIGPLETAASEWHQAHERTDPMTAHIRPPQYQAPQSPCTDGREGLLPFTCRWGTIDTWWLMWRESMFFRDSASEEATHTIADVPIPVNIKAVLSWFSGLKIKGIRNWEGIMVVIQGRTIGKGNGGWILSTHFVCTYGIFKQKSNNKNNNHGELLMKSYSSLRRFWKWVFAGVGTPLVKFITDVHTSNPNQNPKLQSPLSICLCLSVHLSLSLSQRYRDREIERERDREWKERGDYLGIKCSVEEEEQVNMVKI